ncbi:MAG: hypothetical protein AAF960_09870 [Bacteroidota bacterium]
MNRLYILLMVLGSPIWLTANSTTEDWVKPIYKTIYQTRGDFSRPMPTLKITDRVFNIAAYRPQSNELIIEAKAIAICQSMGNQAETALAFLIGHELTHFYQNHAGGFAFLLSKQQLNNQIAIEREADVYGAMLAYLAGYQEIVTVLPTLIEVLYTDYQLDEQRMPAYPAKDARKQLIEEVTERVQALIQLYETAKYLSVVGQYSYAGDLYSYLNKFITTKEILNNLSVAYLNAAASIREFGKKNWAYPLTLDRTNPMRIPADVQKQILLKKAAYHLKVALQYDATYFASNLNYAIALTLQGKYTEALTQLMATSNLTQDHPKTLSIRLLRGIILAEKGDQAASIQLWQSVARSGNDGLSQLAQLNLRLINGEAIGTGPSIRFLQPSSMLIDGINLQTRPTIQTGHVIRLNEDPFNPQTITLQSSPRSTLALLETLEQSVAVQFTRQPLEQGIGKGTSIKKIKAAYNTTNAKIIPHNKAGFFMELPTLGLILLFDAQERLEEWARIAYY